MGSFSTNYKHVLNLLRFFGYYPDSEKTKWKILLYLYSFLMPNFCFLVAWYTKDNRDRLTKWAKINLIGHEFQIFVKTVIRVWEHQKIKKLIIKLDKVKREPNDNIWTFWVLVILTDYLAVYWMHIILSDFRLITILKCFFVTFIYVLPHLLLIFYTIVCLDLINLSRCLRRKRNLEEARIENMKIMSCIKSLDSSFGLQILVSIIFYTMDNFVNLYISIYHERMLLLSSIWYSIIDIIPIYILSVVSPAVIKSVHNVKGKLLKTSLVNKSDEFCTQVNLYVEQLSLTQTEITAWSIFPLNLLLFGHFANILMNLFIAMAQFSDEIREMIKNYQMNKE